MDVDALIGTRNFPGCNAVRIVQNKDEPIRFLFIEWRVSEEAYRSYITWRTERGEYQTLRSMAIKLETDIWPRTVALV